LNNLASAQPAKLRELVALYEAWAARAQVITWDTYTAELAKHPAPAFAK
jgi:hypothetical protein